MLQVILEVHHLFIIPSLFSVQHLCFLSDYLSIVSVKRVRFLGFLLGSLGVFWHPLHFLKGFSL